MNADNNIEQRVRTRAKRGQVKTAILQAAALAGIFTLAVAAPNTLKAIPQSTLKLIFGRSRNSRDVAVARLVKEGLLVRDRHHGIRVLRITDDGRRYLDQESRKHQLMRPGRWDKKWRITIFDIGEKHRKTRDALRRELRTAKFYRLQDSVWVYPFPCEELITLLKADLKVGKDILYIVAEELENDRWLREHFNLLFA